MKNSHLLIALILGAAMSGIFAGDAAGYVIAGAFIAGALAGWLLTGWRR